VAEACTGINASTAQASARTDRLPAIKGNGICVRWDKAIFRYNSLHLASIKASWMPEQNENL
jgi:hypothetical protein